MSRVDEAIVIAGGLSSRLGTEKALLEIGGETFLSRAIGKVSRHASRVGVSVAHDGPSEALRREIERIGHYDLVLDRPGGRSGPLAAIEAGLRWARGGGVLFLAVDMVLVAPQILATIIRRFDATDLRGVVSSCEQGIEPLCAVYSRELAPRVTQRLDRGDRAARDLAEEQGVVCLDFSGEANLEANLDHTFLSVNTDEDYKAVTRIDRGRGTI